MLRGVLPVGSRLATWGTGVALFLAGCGEAGRATVRSEPFAIIGGERSPPGIEDAVLLLRAVVPDAGERICSASLVANNLVVTARHCVAHITDGYFLCSPRGEIIEITEDAGKLGLDLPAENLEFYSNETPRSAPIALGARVVSTLSVSACINDLAFVVLDRSVELPVLTLRRNRPALVGEVVTAVGYGTEEGEALAFESQLRNRKSDLEISAVGPDSTDALGDAPPRIVLVDGPNTCIGDSGGPLLSQDSQALVAVHSLIEGACDDPEARTWYTHLPPLFGWAERAFEAAGRTPTLEPDPPDPCAGGGCAGVGGDTAGGAGGQGGGDAQGGVGGMDTGGSGGEPPDPIDEPDPNPSTRAKRDSGCAFGNAGGGRPGAFLTALALLVSLGRRRSRVSGARRVDRCPAPAARAR
jgi:hypothetical protein